ncbi:hypothetical protein C8J57DRAFT_1728089 [Mycena rebaudengoi]|nr:hypothetical protein C8J57DRAFT_1728089 [Mycena rebaudengoi]
MAVPHMPILTLPATCILLGQSLSRCVAEPIWSRLTSLVPVSHLLLESGRGKRHIVHRRWLNTRPLLHHAAYSWNRMRGGTLVDPVTYGALRAFYLQQGRLSATSILLERVSVPTLDNTGTPHLIDLTLATRLPGNRICTTHSRPQEPSFIYPTLALIPCPTYLRFQSPLPILATILVDSPFIRPPIDVILASLPFIPSTLLLKDTLSLKCLLLYLHPTTALQIRS